MSGCSCWEDFAWSVADDAPDSAAGDALYARIVWGQERSYHSIFKESRASWPRTQRGFLELQRRHPNSLEISSQFCRLACLANDLPQSKVLFEQLGNRVDLAVWQDARAFIKLRRVARLAPA